MIIKPIKYYSTNRRSPEVGFRDALLKGLAPDGGLYMPTQVPVLDKDTVEAFRNKEYYEIAFEVLYSFLENEIEPTYLRKLCRDAYNFGIPLERVYGRKYIMRLDQGPSASFKDFAARMMARLMHHYVSEGDLHFTILTATSGDTGSAVAGAFHGLKGIDVIILFPEKEVSDIQRKQMTTLTENIRTIAIDGKFDDCQRMVKQAFSDPALASLSLTSANSINTGRLLPQSVYYFYAWAKLAENYGDQAIFCVPSGNYGNLMGGLIASRMGLPAKRFIIATNENNEVPEYLRTGHYTPIIPSINCISNAMNVGHPSNFARIMELFGGIMDESGHILQPPDLERMRKELYGVSVSDKVTIETITACYRNFDVVLEPHGAVAWEGLENYAALAKGELPDDQLFISLETAHPGKFRDEINSILGFFPDLPASIGNIKDKKEQFDHIGNNYESLRKHILKHYN